MNVGDTYECKICGNVVELTVVGGGVLVCCGQDMVLQGGAPEAEAAPAEAAEASS